MDKDSYKKGFQDGHKCCAYEKEKLLAENARYREALKGEEVMEKNTQPETFLEHYWFNLGHQSNKIAQENNYLRAQNARYREALEFYVDRGVWGNGCAAIDPCDTYIDELNVLRGGCHAREALKGE